MGVDRYWWCVLWFYIIHVYLCGDCTLSVLWRCKVGVVCCVLCGAFFVLWECDERMCSVGLRCEGVVNCGEMYKDVCITTSV